MADEEAERPDPELLEGHEAFAARALKMVSGAYREIALLTQALDARVYATPEFVDAIRKFVLQHDHTRLRVLVNRTRAALTGGARLVEFGRAMTSHVEFREIPETRRRVVREEYLITDGRLLLYRETPEDLEARYHGAAPHVARMKLKDFDDLWNESTVAQELRKLNL